MMERNHEFVTLTEYIHDVLYFGTVRPGATLKCTEYAHYFCIDEKLIYENYYSDFGPLNVSCIYKYCKILNDKLKNYFNRQKIVHYASNDAKKRSNAAFLLGCYGVLYLHLSPQEALKPLVLNGLTFRPFQDAVQGDSCYTISILDCLNGLKKAKERGFINFQDFNCQEYDRLDKIQGGDLNWIVPGKYLAFIGPVDYNYGMSLYHPPEIYLDYFLENNVSIVIRLNKKFYDAVAFTNMGIYHYDLFFPDGSCPPRHVLLKFLQISEDNPDCAIAVHCKAGLGRTGSLIGCYLIKHYKMTAREAIAWMRICRPGSVIGHQQGWLEQLEPWLMKQGHIFRKRMFQNPDKFPYHEFGIYSHLERRSIIKTPPRSRRDSVRHGHSPSPVNIQRFPNPVSVHTATSTAPSTKTCVLQKMPEPTSSNARGADVKCQPDGRLSAFSRWKLGSQQRDMTRPQSKHLQRLLPDAGGDPRTSHQPRLRKPSPEERKRHGSPVYAGANTARSPQPTHGNSVEDAKNTLRRSLYQLKNGENRRLNKTLDSAIKVSHAATAFVADNVAASIENGSKYEYAAPLCLSSNRSRLGRSPSPPVAGQPSKRSSLKTSTQAPLSRADPSMKSSIGLQKPSALRKELYKLQIAGLHSSHVQRPGPPSVGAGSLGARREAPPGITRETALSARSDDRARATQGDLLNSIKFERRMREADSTRGNGIRPSDCSNNKQFQEMKIKQPQVQYETPGWKLPCDKEPPTSRTSPPCPSAISTKASQLSDKEPQHRLRPPARPSAISTAHELSGKEPLHRLRSSLRPSAISTKATQLSDKETHYRQRLPPASKRYLNQS